MADLIVNNACIVSMNPERTIYPHGAIAIVYSFTGRNAHTVIIDGQIVMQDRELLSLDESSLNRSLAEGSIAWRRRANVSVPNRWPQR